MTIGKFKELIKTGVTLVAFSAYWCAPCKAQKPMIKKIKKKYEKKLSVVTVDIDKSRDLTKRYMVQSIPTLIVFKNGKEIKRLVGIQSEASVLKVLGKIQVVP